MKRVYSRLGLGVMCPISFLVPVYPAAIVKFLLSAPAAAQQPADPSGEDAEASNRVVATLFGAPITLRDLSPSPIALEHLGRQAGLDSPEDWLEKHKAELLRSVIMPELAQRFIKENRLQATTEELKAFHDRMSDSGDVKQKMGEFLKSRIAEIERRLNHPEVSPAEAERLTDELRRAQRRVAGEDWPDAEERAELRSRAAELRELLLDEALYPASRREMEAELKFAERFMDLTDVQAEMEWARYEEEESTARARALVEQWKVSRALYRKYRGRIIWQQIGLEPIDAELKWLEEREKAGDFVIPDLELRNEFYAYFRQNHQFQVNNPTGREFDEPWWLKDPDER